MVAPTDTATRSPRSSKSRPRYSTELVKTVDLQRDAYVLAKEGSTEGIRLKAMSMFKELGDWKRILRGKPLPGSLKPESVKQVVASRPRRARDYLADVAAYQAAQQAAQDSGQTASQTGAPAPDAQSGESGNLA